MEIKTTSLSSKEFNIYNLASATPEIKIADPFFNAEKILEELAKSELKNAQFVVLPELAITGYTCGDLFLQSSLIDSAAKALITISSGLAGDPRLIAIGVPILKDGLLYNCAAVIAGGEIMGFVPKSYIPNYQEFYEQRWFTSGMSIANDSIFFNNESIPFGTDLIFEYADVKIGIEICEDLWVPSPPSSNLCKHGAQIILNLSATDDNIGKYNYIKSLVSSQSARCRCAYAYASAGKGESSTDLVFSGINLIAYDGKIVGESERFSLKDSYASASVDIEKIRLDRRKYSTFCIGKDSEEDKEFRVIRSAANKKNANMDNLSCPIGQLVNFQVSSHPFIPESESQRDRICEETINIQAWGLAQRLKVTHCKHLVIGISGGLDSTLALLVANFTFLKMGLNPEGIIGVTMPAHATSDRTHNNALKLMEMLGITIKEIPINDAVNQHFADIVQDPMVFDSVYENSYARERTQILMDLANKYNGMVLGTGDMSELALGWCTYNGDHMSMYNVNGGVPKTLVKYLVKWFADSSNSSEFKKILYDIVETPISPELIPSETKNEIVQKTEDLIGPYELHDFFLYHVLRNGFTPRKIFYLATLAFKEKYPQEIIKKWLVNFYRRFFSQQFKRSCMPDGPKIGSVCLSPRGDWRMPSDATSSLWIKEAENL